MIEKVNPSHPDKVADRIAGALVDSAYTKNDRPKVAVEVLIGHGTCHIIAETSEHFDDEDVRAIVHRIAGTNMALDYVEVPQDVHLAANQDKEARCGDNGIFKGVPTNSEEKDLASCIRRMYDFYPTDGKFIYDADSGVFIACQSNATSEEIEGFIKDDPIPCRRIIVNPLGDWTGGTDVDTGATNRKLGSDMGRAVTGGGLHGKDLSKADVAVNIACHIMAQWYNTEVEASCAIGDEAVKFTRRSDGYVDIVPYGAILEMASGFIKKLGGFEKLAEWGLF
jgi:S-adenosylmethionine synthetase